MTDIFDTPEYFLITWFYSDKCAARSNVPLINHLNEGIKILTAIGASEYAMRAFCLHPLIQSDADLKENYDNCAFSTANPRVLLLAVEYRSIANQYLSKRIIQSPSDIVLSPLKEVNDMLIADKVQNRKDFHIYHLQTHERAAELEQYFKNWLNRLEISEDRYNELIQIL